MPRPAAQLLNSSLRLKQRLVAHADAQKRTAALDVFPDGFEQFLLLHGVDAIVERAHAGSTTPAAP